MMEKRIVELEKKITFQEHTIEELSQVVAEQQRKLEDLKQTLEHFKEYVNSGDFVKKVEDEEPPPHY